MFTIKKYVINAHSIKMTAKTIPKIGKIFLSVFFISETTPKIRAGNPTTVLHMTAYPYFSEIVLRKLKKIILVIISAKQPMINDTTPNAFAAPETF